MTPPCCDASVLCLADVPVLRISASSTSFILKAPLPGETKVEKRSDTPNPGQADSSPQLGSVNEEKPERKGTGGEAPEVAGKQDGLESMQHSFRSLSSDGESVDVSASSLAGQLVYVHQLRERMSKDQVEMRSLIRCVFAAISLFLVLIPGHCR